jgi:hypothetical protein
MTTSRLIRKSNVPDAVDSFHYNDEKGAKAMVGILGGSTSKHSGLFSAAGDRVKTGLVRYGTVYPHFDASGRRIVIGDAGYNYRVRLENRTKKRIEVIVSVDGLSTLTGKAASPTQRGYILEPKESYDVEGFRKNATTVTSFRFGRVADSVAAAKGGARNVGVDRPGSLRRRRSTRESRAPARAVRPRPCECIPCGEVKAVLVWVIRQFSVYA